MSRLLLFNKPFNMLCQFKPEADKQTLADYVNVPRVYPAGRLDFDSEGLLLLTNDGKLQHRISDPRYKLPKTYLAQVERIPDEAALQKLRAGVVLGDGPTRPALVELIDDPLLWERVPPIRARKTVTTAWIKLTISEGRNRQVRRMTAAIGHPTLRLVRAQIGEWKLGDLLPGEWRDADLPIVV